MTFLCVYLAGQATYPREAFSATEFLARPLQLAPIWPVRSFVGRSGKRYLSGRRSPPPRRGATAKQIENPGQVPRAAPARNRVRRRLDPRHTIWRSLRCIAAGSLVNQTKPDVALDRAA
jgi:hypothetical protein